ncbi:MAG: zinc-binding dehydrogenase [Egibacteraceae bacterium]
MLDVVLLAAGAAGVFVAAFLRHQQRGGTDVFVRPDTAHLAALAELVDAGRLSPHVQSVHDLEAVTEAVTEASSAKVRGKVVIRVPAV